MYSNQWGGDEATFLLNTHNKATRSLENCGQLSKHLNGQRVIEKSLKLNYRMFGVTVTKHTFKD